MIRIERFKPEHLQLLDLQEGQKELRESFGNPDYGRELAACKFAFTAFAPSGEALVIAGVQEIWANRALAWALISRNAGPFFREIHRAVHGFLVQAPWRRVEMMVEDGFAQAHRWAKMLGMEHEGFMRAYSPAGKDFHIYARIKNG